MNITGLDLQPDKNASPWNALFMVFYNLFGAVIILTLFVSIIIQNFSTRSGAALLTTEQSVPQVPPARSLGLVLTEASDLVASQATVARSQEDDCSTVAGQATQGSTRHAAQIVVL